MISAKSKQEEQFLIKAGEYFQKENYPKALSLLRKALRLFPRSPELHYNYGLILGGQQKFKQAIAEYKTAIKLLPTFELAHLNLGVIYIKNDQLDEAIKVFQASVKKNSFNHDALVNLGQALVKKNRLYQAMEIFRQAIELNPNYPLSHFHQGNIFAALGRLDAAANFFKQTIKLDPSFAPAHASLGAVQNQIGQIKDATANFKIALRLGIPTHQVAETLYSLARETCDWRKAKVYDKQLTSLSAQITNTKASSYETLFINITRVDDPSKNLIAARRTANNIKALLLHSPDPFSRYSVLSPHKRVRIGYLSQEFHNHPVTFQIIDLFKYHDKDKFEIFVYSYGINNQSTLRRQIELNAEHFIDLVTVDHQQIAARIHQDKIDILVDLDGFTGFARKDIVAYRPAPIQINYLGFPGTSGTSYIDYLIADTTVIPPQEQIYYSETILYLPDCYQLCSPQKISRQKFTRADFGLPQDAFVFCSFNRAFKVSQEIFDTWIEILKEVKGSVLWLYTDEQLTKKNLRSYFKKSGLSENRLIFTGKLPMDMHLARLKLANLALDTQIYSGGATTANLLWTGVPVITIYGRHYLSRMSSSIISNVGLPELVTKNLTEYKRLAINLATHPKKMVALKQKLTNLRLASPLFKSKLFVKNLENLYQQVFSDYLNQAKNAPKI